MKLINEPTAAAISYGIETNANNQTVFVFDFGGGTFDVSIVHIKDAVYTVKAVSGDTHLGGEDFDNRIVDYCVQLFLKEEDIDIRNHARALRRLRTAIEKAKKILSSSNEVEIEIDAIAEGTDFSHTLTRKKFEELCEADFQKCLPCIQTALDDAKLKKEDIDEVLMIGGSTRIPRIQQMVRDYLSKLSLNKQINPDEAVAVGATMHSIGLGNELIDKNPDIAPGEKQRADIKVIDVIPLSIG